MMEITQTRKFYKNSLDSYHGYITKTQVSGNNINNSIDGRYRFLDCIYFLVNTKQTFYSINLDINHKYIL